MSWHLVPGLKDLLVSKRAEAETGLGCTADGVESGDVGALYKWAEQVLIQLEARAEPIPKLALARALGLLSDPRWTAQVGLPLRATSPRHRVIARLVRERRWVAIWSLNWDCYLEDALEKIGLDRGEPRVRQPWFTAYRTIITASEFKHAARTDVFCVLKPHGCVRALIESRELANKGDITGARDLAERLMITETELTKERRSPTDSKFFTELRSALNKSPMVVAGWSISEPYLLAVINATLKEVIQIGTPEEITIIDVEFNDHGHKQAAKCYELEKEQVFAEIQDGPGKFEFDGLFLWIQAKYALDHLTAHAPESVKPLLEVRAGQLAKPVVGHFLIGWADDFLPAWMRLCWRAGLVPCAGYQAHQLRLELEDEHVPWNLAPLPRPDLAAASILLACLPIDGNPWDPCRFPGALWHKTLGRLVLPVPSWGKLDELAAVGPMLRVLKREIAFVLNFDILPLPESLAQLAVPTEKTHSLRDTVASMMRINGYARADQIGIANDLLRPPGAG